MNKDEFIKKLKKKLEILEDSEIEDIVSEYEGYIEEKVSRGLTEEEAVKELGDFNEIVSDLLAAYKVKEPKNVITFNSIINKISGYLDAFMESLSEKSGKDILKIIIEILLILLFIWICKIPFSIIKDFGWDLFRELSYPISRTFYSIWAFLIELCYVILAVVLFIKIIDKRYFKSFSEKIIDENVEEIEQNKKSKKKKEVKEEVVQTKVIVKEKPKKEFGFIDSLTNICMFFLKFIIVCCLIGVIFYLIGMGFAIGIMIYLLISGVKYFGVFILLIAMFLGGILLLELGINFICDKKIKAWHILGNLLSIIILTGFGLTLGAVEIADTEIIYQSNREMNIKTVTKEIKMDKDIKIYGYESVVIDNSLKDVIKVEYSYPEIEGLDININLEEYSHGLYLDYSASHIRIHKGIFDEIIKNLKDKKIYVYDYDVKKVIYISEENYNILKTNNNYYKNDFETSEMFNKVYTIASIINDDNEYLINVTLYPVDELDEIKTVKISKSLASDLKIGKNYQFTFLYYHDDFYDEDIKAVFKNCKLIAINEVN